MNIKEIEKIIELMNANGIMEFSMEKEAADTTEWEERYGPEVAEAFINEGVNCVLLTPA